MSQVQELKPIEIGIGCVMRAFVDHSKPAGSLGQCWTEVSYDGEPGSEVLAIPNHWHKYHDEKMTVLEGEVDFTLDGVTTRLRPGDEPLDIPRGHPHSIQYVAGVKSTIREETNPSGDFKEWFFRDFFATGFPPSFLYTMRVFFDGDCYPALPLGSRIIDQLFLTIFGGLAKLVVPGKQALKTMQMQ